MHDLALPIKKTPIVGVAKKVVRVGLALFIVGLITTAGYQLVTKYNVGASLLTWGFFGATLLATLYRVVNPIGWTLILHGMGYPTHVPSSIRIWLLSESRRWLPGGVWGYASRAVAAGKLGVPVSVASASIAVELIITMAAAFAVGLLGLAFHYEQLANTFYELVSKQTERLGGTNVALAVAGAVLTCTVLGFVARRKFLTKATGLLERVKLMGSIRLNWTKLATALSYLVAMAVLNGLVNHSLLSVVTSQSVPVVVMIAATATAWIVGFLAFFSPSGILVREATLAMLLLPWLPYELGITLAVLSRIAQLLAEVVCMLPVCFHRESSLPAATV